MGGWDALIQGVGELGGVWEKLDESRKFKKKRRRKKKIIMKKMMVWIEVMGGGRD